MFSLIALRQRALGGASSLVLLALGACASGSHGMYLSGAAASAAESSTSTKGKGDIASGDVGDGSASDTTTASNPATPIMKPTQPSKPRGAADAGDPTSVDTGGGGGGGDPTQETGDPTTGGGGNGGGGVHTQTRAASASGGADMTADLLGRVLHTTGNAVLIATDPVDQLPVAGGILQPVVEKVANTVSNAGLTMVERGTDGLPVVGPLVDNAVAAIDRTAGVATVMIGDTPALAPTSSAQPLAVNIVSADPAAGSKGAVSVLSGGQLLTVSTGQPSNGVIAGATGATPDSLLGGAFGAATLPTGGSPVVALNAGASQPVLGSLATVGVMSNGQPVSVSIGAIPANTGGLGAAAAGVTTSLGAALSPSAGGNPVASAVASVVMPVATVVPTAVAGVTSALSSLSGANANAPSVGAVGSLSAVAASPSATPLASALRTVLSH